MNGITLGIEVLEQQNALLDQLEEEYGNTMNFPLMAYSKLCLMSEYIVLANKRDLVFKLGT